MMPNQRRLACGRRHSGLLTTGRGLPRAGRTKRIVMQLQTKGSEPMRTNIKTLLSTAAVVAALAIGPAVYAYAETPMQNESGRSEEHTSELQSLMRTSYAVFCLNNKIE